MNAYPQTITSSCRTLCRLGWLLLLPLLAPPFRAQATGPEMEIERAAAIVSWPVLDTNYIVLSSANPDGPWVPILDPIAYSAGTCQVAVRTSDHSQYFKLAQGERFMDDFEDGNLGGWTLTYFDFAPQITNYLKLEVTNGQLRIYGTWDGDHKRSAIFHRTNLMLGDFAMSIDILGWDDRVEEVADISLIARLDPSYVNPAVGAYTYFGIAGMRHKEVPTESALGVMEATPTKMDWVGEKQQIAKTDPAKDYRLVFTGVGPDLTVQLFNLTDGILAAAYSTSDDSLTNGWVGFYVNQSGPSGEIDFTLDNFVVVGTTP